MNACDHMLQMLRWIVPGVIVLIYDYIVCGYRIIIIFMRNLMNVNKIKEIFRYKMKHNK